MKLVYKGKTKDVFARDDGNYLLKFKDDATGTDGVFDPGANTVGLSIEGLGNAGLAMTRYFFEKLEAAGVPTHYIACLPEESAMVVKPAIRLGKGLEFICRFRAVGSFTRRYGDYAKEGLPLDAFVEVTLKDDDRGDPPITKDALVMLGVMSDAEYEIIKALTQRIAVFVRDELARHGAELYDIKFEFGRTAGSDEMILIDEITGGNMRAFKDGKQIEPMAFGALLGL